MVSRSSSRSPSRFSRSCRVIIVVSIVALPTVAALPPTPVPVANAAGTPTVEVWSAPADGTRVDGVYSQQVAADQVTQVRWKNFTPGSRVVITQCVTPVRTKNEFEWKDAAGNPPVQWPALQGCGHQTRVVATTGADGEGRTDYPVKVGDLAPVVVSSTNVSTYGSRRFFCNGGRLSPNFPGTEYSCVVTVSECEWDQPLDYHKAGTAPWTLVPRAPKEGVEEPAVAAASGPIRFKNVDGSDAPVNNPNGNPVTTVIPPPKPRKIPQPVEPEAPGPINGKPVGAPILGAGSVNTAVVLQSWLTGVRRLDTSVEADFIRGTSLFGGERLAMGFQNNFKTGPEFAVTGMPLDKSVTGGDVVYAPISLTALAIANSVEYGGLGLNEVRMSADVLAQLLGGGDGVEPAEWGDTQGRSPTAVDNHGCGLPVLEAAQIFRGGVSAQSRVLSEWLAANLSQERFKTFFASAPGEVELRPIQAIDQRATDNGAQTAFQIATVFGAATDPDPDDDVIPQPAIEAKRKAGALGYVDITEVNAQRAAGVPLPVVALRNAAGKYVLPTKEAILDAYSVMKVNADGTRTPTFDHADKPGMYPLPMLHYIAVPKTDGKGRNPVPIKKRQALAALIDYIVSDEAQAKVGELGGVPLPDELRKQSRAVAKMLLKADPPADTPDPGNGGGGDGGNGGGGSGGGNGGGGTGTTPGGTTPGGGTQPTSSPAATTSAAPAPAVAMSPVKNEGTVRGGKIPGAKGIVPITIIAVVGGVALLAGGGWRGYLLWRRWSISQVGRR